MTDIVEGVAQRSSAGTDRFNDEDEPDLRRENENESTWPQTVSARDNRRATVSAVILSFTDPLSYPKIAMKRFIQRKATATRLRKIVETTNNTSPVVDSLRYVEALVDHLGLDGMSSDESDVEEDETILGVHEMPHRRDVDDLMDFLDSEYQDMLQGCEDGKSSFPRRVRHKFNPSQRPPFSDKDESVFEPSWLSSCSNKPKTQKGTFTWVPVVMTPQPDDE